MNEVNIEYICENCGMEFSIPSNVLQVDDEDLTCPVCQEPVSTGDSNEQDEEWEDSDDDQDDDEDPPEPEAVQAR